MSLVAKVGATVLDRASGKEWLDEIAGPGRFRLTFKNGDAQIPADGAVVTFEIDGTPRFAGVVDADSIVSKARGEAKDQLTTVTGPGMLGVTKRGLVRPTRGVGSLPTERERSQFWGAWDFDISAVPLGKNIRRADAATSYAPNRSMPEWWPAKQAWWVWSDQVDVSESDAPLGRCLIWHEFDVASSGEIEIHIAVNNQGYAYLNGARLGDISNAPKDGQRFRVEVTAGTHRIAASVTNFIRDGGYIDAIWTVDDDGLLDDLIAFSDETNTKVLGYPDDLPTITPGEAIRRVLEQMQDNDELTGVTLGFTDSLDSAGNPWVGVVEIPSTVGTKLSEYLLALSDWAIDVYVSPGSEVNAWNWGTRGDPTAVEVVGTTNRLTSEVEGLSHRGSDVMANRLLVAFRRGLIEVEDAASVTEHGPVPDFVDLGDFETSEAARSAALALIESRKDKTYATTLTLAPVAAIPYEDFDVGDYIEHPDEVGGTKVSRVLSISVTEDTEGNLTYVLELHAIHRAAQDRHDNTLKRFAMGSLAGGARVVARSGESLPSLSRISDKQVAEFSIDGPVGDPATFSPKRPASSSGNLVEVFGELTTAGTSTSEFDVLRNGVVIATLTFPSGETEAEVNLDGAKTYRNVDKYQIQRITAGTGAEGLDIQVRAI